MPILSRTNLALITHKTDASSGPWFICTALRIMWKIRILQAIVTAGIVLAFQGLFIYNGVLTPKNSAPEQIRLKVSSDQPSIDEVCYKDPNDPSRIGRPFLLPPEYAIAIQFQSNYF